VASPEYDQKGTRKQVKARREVILSGGVVASPQLLQLSGIGDPERLGRIGVKVRHSLKGVGRNLRDHYAVRMVAKVKGVSTINQSAKGLGLVGEVAKYFTGQPSILGLCPSLVHIFWKSHQAVHGNDLQMTFTPASYKEGVQSQLDDFPGVTCAPWQQRPESSGHLLARSANPFEAPEIQPNYLSDEMDRQVLLGGMRLARKLLQTPEMLAYSAAEEYPGADAVSDDELLALGRQRKGFSMKLRAIFLSLAIAVGVTACKTTNETVGAVLGGIGGSAASYGLVRALGGDSTTTTAAAIGGGLAGAYFGSRIGQQLDGDDREKAAAASAKAVTTGKTGQSVAWKSKKNPNVYGQTKVVDTGTISTKSSKPTVKWQRSKKREPIRAVPVTTTGQSSTSASNQSASKATEPTATVPSRTTPTQTAAIEPADNKLCKKVDEVAYINGSFARVQTVVGHR
jgi:surface antigen